ncbi:MAG: UDP-glucose/GDP-mannose dehydrogenase family, binding domain [Actinomycetota bacterium]|nr:UDP-glucose/GDP-mannose dehydrogenase family, binding domain [Actinomycetota bacterium]
MNVTHNREPVAVIGLGYVGLPLAVAAATAGYPVYGLDIRSARGHRHGR